MSSMTNEIGLAIDAIEEAVKKDLTAAAVAVNRGERKAALQALSDAGEKLIKVQMRLRQFTQT